MLTIVSSYRRWLAPGPTIAGLSVELVSVRHALQLANARTLSATTIHTIELAAAKAATFAALAQLAAANALATTTAFAAELTVSKVEAVGFAERLRNLGASHVVLPRPSGSLLTFDMEATARRRLAMGRGGNRSTSGPGDLHQNPV